MTTFIQKILFPILLLFFILLIFLYQINHSDTTISHYTLKSYKNTVALYKNEKIVQLYNEIVLNTLPTQDIQNFKKGISVSSPDQAEIYLQDFE